MGRIVVKRNGLEDLYLDERNNITILNASLSREILNNDFVSVKVKSTDILDIKINDTILIDGRVYRMNTPPEWIMLAERVYEYDLRFEGSMYDLVRTLFLNEDGTGFSTTAEFSSVGDLEHFMTIIKNNIHRFSTKWTLGNMPDGETKTISFSSENCLSALQTICTEFGVEFRIDYDLINDFNVINLGDFGEEFPYSFEYGKGNGLYNLSLRNIEQKNIINRLYIYGGSDNLPVGYRNYSDKLKIGDQDYIQDDAMIAEFGLVEGIANFSDIYPHRTGKITTKVDETTFIDTTMNFDLKEKDTAGNSKYLLPDKSAKVSFKTGNLAGYQFEVPKNDGYNHTDKKFKIIPQTIEQNIKIPDDTGAFQYNVNDEYVLLDIAMPQSYINEAEEKLLEKGNEEFLKLKQSLVAYELSISPLFLKSLNNGVAQIMFDIGDYVRIIHQKLGINKLIRVIMVEKDLMKVGSYRVTVADEFIVNDIRQLIYDVKAIQTVLNLTGQLNITKSMIGYKTTEELKNMVFDTDNYFDAENIRPNSIETNMLSVGAKSQQLSCSCTFYLNENGDPNKLRVSMGQLFWQVEEKVWNIGAQTYSLNDNNARYIYARCQRNGNQGVMFLTTEQIIFDSDVNDFYFLIGILHSVVSGYRILSLTFGTTTINGGLIRTGIISSLDGATYFNLNTGEIKGRIEFSDNSPAFGQLASGGENLIFEVDNEYNFTTDIDRYFNKLLKYVFSIDVKNTFNLTGATLFLIGKKNNQYSVIAEKNIIFDLNAQNGISRFSILAEFKINEYQRLFCKVIGANDQDFPIQKPKLEIGSNPSDYSISQLLLSQKITEIENKANWFTTTITGNVITTGTLLLGNYESGSNGGITGEGNSDEVFLWGGSAYAGKDTAPIRLYRNGKFYAQNAHIEGYVKATDGEFTGKVNAKEGNFGDTSGNTFFTISSRGLESKQGWLVTGDYTNYNGESGGKFVQIQAIQSAGSYLVEIDSSKSGSIANSCLRLNARGSSNSNIALDIRAGNIRVDGSLGFTGTKIINGVSLVFKNGILIG